MDILTIVSLTGSSSVDMMAALRELDLDYLQLVNLERIGLTIFVAFALKIKI